MGSILEHVASLDAYTVLSFKMIGNIYLSKTGLWASWLVKYTTNLPFIVKGELYP